VGRLRYPDGRGLGVRRWRERQARLACARAPSRQMDCARFNDADTAKRLAQQAVENPTEPRASKFGAPLNLLGGERRTAYAPELDSPTREYVRDVEIGAVLQKAPNEQPQASGDDESINVSAADDDVARAMAEEREWLDWPPADDGGDD
jgi:hypothetical protein